MQRLVIGDIHGCYAELIELVDKAGLATGDEVIAIGDIVDRGPDTPKVVDFFQKQAGARSILGNHERKHIRSFGGQMQPALSQVITRAQFGDRYPSVIDFLQKFPLYLDLPEAILAHGFWEPGLPLTEQKETVLAGVMSGEEMLRARGWWPWYDRYDGPKPIIVGHRHYLGTGQPLILEDKVWAIDTGCVRGRRLTGLLLPSFRIVSVPARDNHWLTVSQSFAKSADFAPQEIPPWDAESEADLQTIYDYILAQHALTLKKLEKDSEWQYLSDRKRAKLYEAEVKGKPLADWMHRARQGTLTLDALRRHFWHPERAETLAEEMGLR